MVKKELIESIESILECKCSCDGNKLTFLKQEFSGEKIYALMAHHKSEIEDIVFKGKMHYCMINIFIIL